MNKKIVLITLLSSTLLLYGCGKKEDSKNIKVENKPKIETANSKNANSESVSAENSEKLEDTTKKLNKDSLKKLMDDSDYISRIKVLASQEGNDVTFVEDFKGDLSNIEIELPKSLLANREYIIFYTDTKKGKIEPTNGDDSFIEVEGNNDATLNYIESMYQKDNVPKVTSGKTSDKN